MITADEYNDIYNKYVASRLEYPVWLKEVLVMGALGMALAFFAIYSLVARYQIRRKTEELRDTVKREQALRMEKERMLVHKSKMAQLGEMVNSVTHQWKQPLSTINMIAENMKDVEYDEVVDKEQIIADANAITDQVRFMSNTMDDFSGFTSPTVRMSDFDITSACNDALKLVKHSLEFSKVKAEVSCSEQISARGPKNDFVHIIINLLTNSMDAFTSRGIKDGWVSISISKLDDRKTLLVYRDNAGGLQGVSTEEIFEPYISTKPDDSGTGIGLYLSRNILRKSFRGDIRAEDVDSGLSFYIEMKN